MRITCPLCGPRDRREFYYYGSADYLKRPGEGAAPAAWDNYLHLRDNPAGETRDLWYHDMGCSSWLELTRDTVTHAVSAVRLIVDPSGSEVGNSTEKTPAAKRTVAKKPAAKAKGATT